MLPNPLHTAGVVVVHIPDGYLNVPTWAGMLAASVVALQLAARKSRGQLQAQEIPILGMTGAFIFAAQMVNFPVALGTSGHLLGGALAVALVGPWNASLVLAAVLAIQALFFQDGGLLAFGANTFNMAVLAPWVAYACLRYIPGRQRWPAWSIFCASLFSVVAAASMAALQLAFSGVAPLGKILPAMLIWHVLIGVGEGVITTGVLGYLQRSGRWSGLRERFV